MKRRNGFVSNSSSTSFCIFGVIIDDAWGDVEDAVWKNGGEKSLMVERGVDTYYDTNFIGVDPNEIRDSETFGEFKIRVSKSISDIVGADVDVGSLSYYTDGGYDS